MKYLILGVLLFSTHVSAWAEDFLGKYKSVSTIGVGLFGGDHIEIYEKGFNHQVHTDYTCSRRDCPELYKPPYKRYRGEYKIEGNKITFLSKYMRENVFYIVKVKEWQALLPEKSYEMYKKNGVIPSIIIAKQNDA